MPKAIPKKSRKNFYLKWATGVLVIILAVAGYRIFVIQKEKTAFLDQQQKIKIKVDDVADKFPPSSRSSSEYCRNLSQKYSKGPLVCAFGYTLNYKVGSVDEANKLKDEISEYVSASPLTNNMSGGTVFLPYDDNSNKDDLANSYIVQKVDIKGICHSLASYGYDPKKGVIEFDVGCSADAKASYFKHIR